MVRNRNTVDPVLKSRQNRRIELWGHRCQEVPRAVSHVGTSWQFDSVASIMARHFGSMHAGETRSKGERHRRMFNVGMQRTINRQHALVWQLRNPPLAIIKTNLRTQYNAISSYVQILARKALGGAVLPVTAP